MSLESNDELSVIVERARRAVDDLARSGKWTKADDEHLDALFEQAATAALRVPAITERSRVLRGLARRFIPQPLRPLVRSAGRFVDRVLRGIYRLVRAKGSSQQ